MKPAKKYFEISCSCSLFQCSILWGFEILFCKAFMIKYTINKRVLVFTCPIDVTPKAIGLVGDLAPPTFLSLFYCIFIGIYSLLSTLKSLPRDTLYFTMLLSFFLFYLIKTWKGECGSQDMRGRHPVAPQATFYARV